MVQDTRKDPRAKVLTMTVRYKSATIDEFIEHHSHDVSRGGIFIKTPSPFPPGTLLKFEIRISEDRSVLGGVGRVVWKRDPPQATTERPAGMGVKFLKIDETSRLTIDRIVASKGDMMSEFETGGAEAAAAEQPPAARPSAPAPVKSVPSRKATMLGLGAVNPSSQPPAQPASTPPKEKFFPETPSESPNLPPPEERTVMRQAAELLAEALKGAGGSMEEIGAAPAAKPTDAAAPAKAAEAPEPETPERVQDQPGAVHEEPKPAPEPVKPAKAKEPTEEPKPVSEPPKAIEPAEAIRKEPAQADAVSAKKVDKPSAVESSGAERPWGEESAKRQRPISVPAAASASPEKGGSRALIYLGLIAVVAAAIWYLRQEPASPENPAGSQTSQTSNPPTKPLPPDTVSPTVTPVATPAETTPPVVAWDAGAAPAVASSSPTTKQPTPKATDAQPTPVVKTVAPKPAPTPTEPKPTPTPAPKPAPKPTSDNPY